MKAIVYYLSLPFLYLVSIVPFAWIYRISDFLYFILYRLGSYRKNIVHTNLKNSFPDKNEVERLQIQQNFYRFFFDLMLETIKTMSISPEELRKRILFEDTSILHKYAELQQSIIIVMGHFGNWELGGARFAIDDFHKLVVVYHPLQNEYFDQLMYKMRTRLGNGLYTMKNTLRGMIEHKNQLTATAFIADQTPPRHGAYWMDFLNQDTPVFTGTGKIANKFNYPVIYASVKRTKRGYYTILLEELCANPSQTEPEEIVAQFFRKLEQDIREMPETWLWTHRRWKRQRTSPNNTNTNA